MRNIMVDMNVITGLATNVVSKPVETWWVVLVVLGLLVIFYILRQFFDIIVDMWKLPFAIVIDAIDVLAYNNPYFDVLATLGNLILFWALAKRGDHMGKLFGIIAGVEAIIGIWILPQYASFTNLLPISTILMIIIIWSS